MNQPDDISLDSRYETICGITEEELYSVFDKSIDDLARKYECSIDMMKSILKKKYDGYHFSDKLTDVYNPFSLINVFAKNFLDDYWYRTGTPYYLTKLLEQNNINIQALIAKEYQAKSFIDYRANSEDSLSIFYQSGYLTIKSFDKRDGVYTLDFPND